MSKRRCFVTVPRGFLAFNDLPLIFDDVVAFALKATSYNYDVVIIIIKKVY